MLRAVETIAIFAALLFALCLFVLIFLYGSSPTPSTLPPQQQNAADTKTIESLWEKATNDPVALFTFWLVVFTAVLSLVGVFQFGLLRRGETVAEKSANAAQKAADVAEATLVVANRPWLYADITVTRFDYPAGGPVHIQFGFSYKNTGATPAVNIAAAVGVPNLTPGASPRGNMTAIKSQMDAFCAARRKPPTGDMLFRAFQQYFTWFPNQDTPKSLPVPETPLAITNEQIFGNLNNIMIYGCITYESTVKKDERHQTRFLYWLKSKDNTPIVDATAVELVPFGGFDAD